MSYTYKGFWDPFATYSVDDLVRYYSADGYSAAPEVYKCIAEKPARWRRRGYNLYSSGDYVVNSGLTWEAVAATSSFPGNPEGFSNWDLVSTDFHCPIKYFRYPILDNNDAIAPDVKVLGQQNGMYRVVVSTGGEQWNIAENVDRKTANDTSKKYISNFVYLNSRDLMAVAGNTDGWTNSRYYHENQDTSQPSFWKGPNGATDLLEINSAFWVKVEVSDTTIFNSDWSSTNEYDSSAQEYNSDGLSTLNQGEFSSNVSQEISFDEVQGETDSDAYYISSVQNYKGNFKESAEYMQFDVVRNPHSHLFCYARTDISQPDDFENGDDLVFTDVIIKSPIENVEN